MTGSQSPEFLSAAETARRMNTTESTVRDLARKGYLPGARQSRPRGPWEIPAEAVEAWLKKPILPPKPFYQRGWFIAIAAIIGLLAAVAGFLSDSGLRNSLANAFAVPTPLPFTSEAPGETLIVIATFHRTEGVIDVDTQGEIQRAIQDKLAKLGTDNVRVEIEPTVIESRDRETAERVGRQYNASMIIWGADTGVRLEVNFLNLKEPDFAAAAAGISETRRSQLAQPDAYARFVTDELPNKFTFLALFAIGQSFYIQEQYEHAIPVIKEALCLLSDATDLDLDEEAMCPLPNAANIPADFDLDEAYFRLGWLYQIIGNIPEAIASYDHAIALNPQYADAYNNRGIAHAHMGEYAKAIADFDQVIALNPQDTDAYNNRGSAYGDLGEYVKAIANFDQAIVLNPQHANAYYNRGNAYVTLSEYAKAIADFDRAIAINPQDAMTYNNRGNAYATLSEYANAIVDYDRAIAINPQYTKAYINRGGAYTNLGEYARAIADYDQAITIDPQFTEAYYNRGVAYNDLGDYERALADFNQAIALNPQYPAAYNNRGTVYANQGEYSKAIADFNQAIAFNSQYAKAYSNRGLTYAVLGEYAKAISDYDQAIILNPQDPGVYNNRGTAYDSLREYAKAITNYDQAIALNPKNANAYYNRGNAYANLGEYAKGLSDLDEAIILNPRFADAYYNRGWIYIQERDWDAAWRDLKNYLETYPANAIAWNTICWYGSLLGDANEVTDACEQAISLASTPAELAAYHDSRGLNHALTDDFDTAISDFEQYVDFFKDDPNYTESVEKRVAWIEALRAGINPFDASTLAELLEE